MKMLPDVKSKEQANNFCFQMSSLYLKKKKFFLKGNRLFTDSDTKNKNKKK